MTTRHKDEDLGDLLCAVVRRFAVAYESRIRIAVATERAAAALETSALMLTRIAPGRPWSAKVNFWKGGEQMSDTITIKDTDPGAAAAVTFTDADGQPTTPDAGDVPTWPLDDPNGVVTPTVSADGLSATFVPTGTALGAASGHVELVEAATGNTIVTETFTITVTGGEPTQGTVDLQPISA